MSFDNFTVEIFKFIDALAQIYTRDINSYKEVQKAINIFLQQKEIKLREIEEKTAQLLKGSIAEKTVPVETEPVIENENFNYAGVKVETLERLVESPGQASETPTSKTARNRRREIIAVRKAKSFRSGKAKKQIKCLYHPNADAVDKQRRLCSSCKWKIKAYGLKEHLNNPAVVSYLKGETKIVPNVGQPMCPLHPTKPSFNKKTGLCQYCHSKARVIGVTDRKLDDEELEIISNGPVAW